MQCNAEIAKLATIFMELAQLAVLRLTGALLN